MLDEVLRFVAVQLLLDRVRHDERRLDGQVEVDVGRVLRRVAAAAAGRVATAAAQDQSGS